MNEEIVQEIKGMIPWLIVAVLAVGGFYGYKGYRESQRVARSEAFAQANTAEELEAAVAQCGESNMTKALKLKLAKAYFDDARYEESLGLYDELATAAPEGFADVPAVGRAQCLEGMAKYDEALAAYENFASANPSSYLALTARLGAARVTALKGDAAAATAKLDALKAEAGDDGLARSRIEQLEGVIRRLAK